MCNQLTDLAMSVLLRKTIFLPVSTSWFVSLRLLNSHLALGCLSSVLLSMMPFLQLYLFGNQVHLNNATKNWCKPKLSYFGVCTPAFIWFKTKVSYCDISNSSGSGSLPFSIGMSLSGTSTSSICSSNVWHIFFLELVKKSLWFI